MYYLYLCLAAFNFNVPTPRLCPAHLGTFQNRRNHVPPNVDLKLYLTKTHHRLSKMNDNKPSNPSAVEKIMASALLEIRSDQAKRTTGPAAAPPSKKQLPLAPARAGSGSHNLSSLRPNNLAGINQALAQGQNPFAFNALASLQAASGSATYPSPGALLNLFSRGPAPATHFHPMPQSSNQGFASSSERSGSVVTDGSDDQVNQAVRREKVEAALRSKPQRGRKRENLSELERLELTRTRNREHAKSTRVRKKARYQELLDCEQKLKDIDREEKLLNCRRQCILDFLSLREQSIHYGNSSDESGASDSTPQASNSDPHKIEDLVEKVADFRFTEGSTSVVGDEALRQLKAFDDSISSRVTKRFGSSVVPLLSLAIKGSAKGIALSDAHWGFALVELIMPDHLSCHLISGILRFEFGADSSKLRSVGWTQIDDALDNESVERLRLQISHPSVVSLDPLASEPTTAASEKPEYTSSGPGMSI